MLDPVPHAAWCLVGATATGKSAVAQWLAARCRGIVVSADAMLVYRGMDIGTAKPSPAERGDVPYLGIDLADVGQLFSVGEWLATVRRQLAASDPSRPLIVAGGSGLYVKALLGGLDAEPPDPANRAAIRRLFEAHGTAGLRQALAAAAPAALASLDDPHNPRRLMRALETVRAAGAGERRWADRPWPTVVGLRMPRPVLQRRIRQRVEAMFTAGLVSEAVRLRERFPAWSETAGRSIGYAEALAFADGGSSREAAVEAVVVRTRQLAKRQETWFRHQLPVTWVDVQADEPVEAVAERVLNAWREHGPAPISQG